MCIVCKLNYLYLILVGLNIKHTTWGRQTEPQNPDKTEASSAFALEDPTTKTDSLIGNTATAKHGARYRPCLVSIFCPFWPKTQMTTQTARVLSDVSTTHVGGPREMHGATDSPKCNSAPVFPKKLCVSRPYHRSPDPLPPSNPCFSAHSSDASSRGESPCRVVQLPRCPERLSHGVRPRGRCGRWRRRSSVVEFDS
jgi:hypothetical protein